MSTGPILVVPPDHPLRPIRRVVLRAKAPAQHARQSLWHMILLGITVILGAFTCWWELGSWDAATLPTREPNRGGITILAANGNLLARLGDLPGELIDPNHLPDHLSNAVLAIEDRRFSWHPGVDPLGIGRALVRNLSSDGTLEGGSTITQQLVKRTLLDPERSLRRKLHEAVLALAVERRYSKREILAAYLNWAYFGSGAHGADMAARLFFGRSAGELRLEEAAILAGSLKAPSRLNLHADREATLARARQVLRAMVDTRAITPREAVLAIDALHRVKPQPQPARNGYFIDWVAEQVRGMPQTWGRQVEVSTTLDSGLQTAVETRLATMLRQSGGADDFSQGAIVVMAPSGAVQAMVGGSNYGESPFNRAVSARRQPGSAFKPFIYLTALEQGGNADTPLDDSPLQLGTWRPRNFNGAYQGTVSLRTAFIQSLNAPSVRLATQVGIDNVIRMAARSGIVSPLRHDASLALGTSEVTPLELTGAIAMLPNGGMKSDPHGVLEIRDTSGQVLYRHYSEPIKVIDPATANEMVALMQAVVTDGTGRAARLDRPAAGKTGTSQSNRDAWFVGFTADLVAGVWLGNDNGAPMRQVTGAAHPARLWRQVMQDAHQGLPSPFLSPVPHVPQPGPEAGGELAIGEREALENAETLLLQITSSR